jgi:hypothetical protein
MEDTGLFLRIDTLLLRSLTLIQFVYLLEINYPRVRNFILRGEILSKR